MKIGNLIAKLSNPRLAGFYLLAQIWPNKIVNKGSQDAVKQGLSESVFVLSFDCDTELDISVVENVHKKLVQKGIKPIYAVPGELLIQGSEVYKRIHDSGAEFINHGYRRHSEVSLPDRKYFGTFFYEQAGRAAVVEDIMLGHEAIHKVLGINTTIFRTPHFGGFAKTSQLDHLWKTLRAFKYEVSTSTTPYFAFVNGPISFHGGICELPVSADPQRPYQILDSWSYAFSEKRSLSKEDYIAAINQLADEMIAGKIRFLNIYADPSQVYDWPEFFEAIARLRKFNVDSFLAVKSAFHS
jgi:peptidoglycan/xylan/chitin deacetylase (PgdA/CDA1 family)